MHSTEQEKRCCTPTHDAYIQEQFAGLWPDECSSDDFGGLNILKCAVCHEDQPKFTDTSRKIIRVCRSLIESIYGQKDLDKPTSSYQKCGGWSSPRTIYKPTKENGSWEDGYTVTTEDSVLINPKSTYPNAETFFSNFAQMSIPFMSDYKIQVVDDIDEETGVENVCLKAGASSDHVMSLVAASLALVSMALF